MLASLARRVDYGGNPEHKRHPGDYVLTYPMPSADPLREEVLRRWKAR